MQTQLISEPGRFPQHRGSICWPRAASPGSANAGDDNAIVESAMI